MTTNTGQTQTPPKVEPQKEHNWLQRFVGEWTYEMEAPMGPGQPMTKFTGSETARSMGDVWIVAEGKGTMGESGEETSLLTLGYDPNKKRFVGSWVGSMMTHLWIYNGELNPGETTLTLSSEGPAMTPEGQIIAGKTALYRDIHEFKSNDHRVLTAHVQGDDGKWQQFMEMHYHRRS